MKSYSEQQHQVGFEGPVVGQFNVLYSQNWLWRGPNYLDMLGIAQTQRQSPLIALALHP
jgi:hypothetical protein